MSYTPGISAASETSAARLRHQHRLLKIAVHKIEGVPMTDPTLDAQTMTVRERLEDAARAQWRGQPTMFQDMVDAILAELQEPTEGMLCAAMDVAGTAELQFEPDRHTWIAIIQHIRAGGK